MSELPCLQGPNQAGRHRTDVARRLKVSAPRGTSVPLPRVKLLDPENSRAVTRLSHGGDNHLTDMLTY